jgi:2-(1,2-epoxy-1,2-dihydrophenyl)acetyl-CoA isomerase
MGDFETVRLEVGQGVATITLSQPQRLNATTPLVIGEIMAAVDLSLQEGARVLVFTGEGRAFCSGAGLKDEHGAPTLTGDLGQVLEDHYNPLFVRLAELPIPIVSLVQGPAAGAGCSLALAADFVIASHAAYFLMAFVNIGLVPDMGATWLLPRLVGLPRATEMMMLGEKVSAQSAEAWGLIYRATPAEALQGTAAALIERLARGPTVAFGLLRTALRAGLHQPLAASLALERLNQRRAGDTADCAEGVRAFLEKRAAVFTGA